MVVRRRTAARRGVAIQGITPFLWFDHQAEEAARFYVSLFRGSKINAIVPYGEAGPGTPGSTMVVDFRLGRQNFTALNGGPVFRFSPAMSLVIRCKTQQQVDHLWRRLGEGGKPGQCGWIEDRFGVTWQVVPDRLIELLSDRNAAKAARVNVAMLKMKKFEIRELEEAARGPPPKRRVARRRRK